ncbi:PREDICTED: uncharacterized protein LOC108779395, partial [Cyphomyrmex costatus]|uniref:uncharacterized protein LOC108779395 n=1 Tax=Cyphomyrmex costatus TaxID=456900 RepID=UPI00085242F5
MFGAEDLVLLKQTRDQVKQMLMAGGFKPHKWASNDPRLMDDIPEAEQALRVNKTFDCTTSLKILGISWNPCEDEFRVQIRSENPLIFTKRSFLSLIARIFDPLGWVAPATITAKILIQLLWLNRVEWDTPLTGDLLSKCQLFTSQLAGLGNVSIPRWTKLGDEPQAVELHGFSDASNAAYAAVVYLRVESLVGQRQVSLMYAKTKVAPLKVLSVPRLELCAAVLLTRSLDFVQKAMKLVNVPTFCWTDSSVVLAWLNATPSRWKTFVANRVSEIHSTLPNAAWKHVPTAMNPADCASRGMSASDLIQHSLWWQGPTWLWCPATEWPDSKRPLESNVDLERRIDNHVHFAMDGAQKLAWSLPYEVSTWSRLLRITAY